QDASRRREVLRRRIFTFFHTEMIKAWRGRSVQACAPSAELPLRSLTLNELPGIAGRRSCNLPVLDSARQLYQRNRSFFRAQPQPRSALIDGGTNRMVSVPGLHVQGKITVKAGSAAAFIVHVKTGILRRLQHDCTLIVLQVHTLAQGLGADLRVSLVGFDFQGAAQRDIAQPDCFLVSINADGAGGGVDRDGGLVAFDLDVALNGGDSDVRLIAFQVHIDLPRHVNFQFDGRTVVVVFPAKHAIPFRILYFDGNPVGFTAEIDLDVFHPPLAVCFAPLESLGHVNDYLVGVRTGDVDGPFIVVNLERAARGDGKA